MIPTNSLFPLARTLASLFKGFCDLFLIFQGQRIRMIEISGDRSLGKTSVFCNIGKCYLFFSHKKIVSF